MSNANANTTSARNVIEESIKNICTNYSVQLSDWLQENKNVEVTPEEICTAWEMPYKPMLTPGMPNGVSVQTKLPDYYAGTGTASPSKKKGGGGGRSKKPSDPNAPKCEYKMTRGKNPGKGCENPVLNDGTLGADRFCKSCLKKAAVQKILEKPDDKSTVKPPVLSGTSIDVPEEGEKKTDEISVIEIPGKPGWFKEQNHNFIIEQESSGNIIAHQIEENGVCRDLNEKEKKLAASIGFHVVNSNVNSVNSSTSSESVSSIPNIPNVVVPQ